jgi:phosphate transport system permease protein
MSAQTSAERVGRDRFNVNLSRRHLIGGAFRVVALLGTLVGILVLAVLLIEVWRDGFRFLELDFLNRFPSRFPDRAGLKSAFWGSLWLIGLTAALAFPIGVGAAVYLEEYAPKNMITRLLQTNISNLAGVPSIVYGLLGLQLFVRGTIGVGPSLEDLGLRDLDRSVAAGAATIALLILPVVIVASQEALKAVPPSVREASYGVGATRWQTIRHHVLPEAFPGIMTGTILALSRAIGETAPLITIGALTFVAFTPTGPLDEFTAMPIQIFNWAARPQQDFQDLAATGIIVLLVVLLTMNAIAVYLRHRVGGPARR